MASAVKVVEYNHEALVLGEPTLALRLAVANREVIGVGIDALRLGALV